MSIPRENAQQKAAREARELLHGHLRTVLGSQPGRAVMWWVLNELGYLLSQSDVGEATHASARNAGRRDVALELLAELQAASKEHYRQMLLENLKLAPPESPRT